MPVRNLSEIANLLHVFYLIHGQMIHETTTKARQLPTYLITCFSQMGNTGPNDVFAEFKDVGSQLADFRWRELEPARWWGVSNQSLRELLQKLSRALSEIEKEVRERVESGASHKETVEKAKSASEGLDGILIQIAEQIEQLLSGIDLVEVQQG